MSLVVSAAATLLAIALPQAAAPIAVPTRAPVEATVEALPPADETAPAIAAPQTDAPATPSAPPPVVSEDHQAEIIVRARGPGYAPDPLRGVNAEAFAVTLAVDKAVIAPAARAYKKVVPTPVRKGVHNFLYNLREPVVFLNFLLQHKIGKAAETVGRFLINTTIGVVGVFDAAKKRPFKLPRRGNGFANTLGFYGVKPGPFLFLPLVGPTTVRDLFGGAVDRIVLPVAAGSQVTKPEFTIPAAVLGSLDHRAEFDETLHALHDNAADPYANSRDFYLQRRQTEIDRLHGRAPSGAGLMSEPPKGPITLDGRTLAPVPDPVPPK